MKKRILYIDDNFDNVLLVERIVKAEGHVLLNDCGQNFKGSNPRPDLIIVSVCASTAVDSLPVIRRLKRQPHLRAVPIVALVSAARIGMRADLEAAGCEEIVYKPADIRQIQALLRRHLARVRPVRPAVPHYRAPAVVAPA